MKFSYSGFLQQADQNIVSLYTEKSVIESL